VEDNLVDLFPVDGMGHGNSDVFGPERLAQGGLWTIPVQVIGGATIRASDSKLEFAPGFFGFQDREHVDPGVAAKKIDFAVCKLEQNDLSILDDAEHEAVGVRELVACGIDFVHPGGAFNGSMVSELVADHVGHFDDVVIIL